MISIISAKVEGSSSLLPFSFKRNKPVNDVHMNKVLTRTHTCTLLLFETQRSTILVPYEIPTVDLLEEFLAEKFGWIAEF